MPPRPALCAVALALALARPAAGEPASGEQVLAEQPPAVAEALLRDKVVLASQEPAGVAQALVLFAPPIDRVYELLAQTSRQREFRPELSSVETVESLPDGSIEEQRMRILFLDIRYWLRNRLDREGRRIGWELAPGFQQDLERVEGSWELHPFAPGRTLGVFRTRVEVGKAMPSFLQDYATRKNLPATLERCRQWVDTRGRLRP